MYSNVGNTRDASQPASKPSVGIEYSSQLRRRRRLLDGKKKLGAAAAITERAGTCGIILQSL